MTKKLSSHGNPGWPSNDKINNIQGLIDIITDKSGNYYTVYEITTYENKIEEVKLAHSLYDIAFASTFLMEEVVEGYLGNHLGDFMLDVLNGHLRTLEICERKIFSVQDLLDNKIKVEYWDMTQPPPEAPQAGWSFITE
ncbi:hypothetical protein GCM10008931_42740 [Oceanobacillus oncorhynchi subsp. oncorhynchi]|uniref:hypothetical protein n=1 Tax=Oceanobacillus oncorhynchi TaxID=545501 RepID=UPI0031D72537